MNGACHHPSVYQHRRRPIPVTPISPRSLVPPAPTGYAARSLGRLGGAAVLAALAATALAACSAQTDYGNNPSGVATSYFHRLYNNDFTGAGQLLTDQLRGSLGDCAGALRRARDELPVGERDELRDVSVRLAIRQTKDSAQVSTTDVTVTATTAPRTVRGTPKPRSTQIRSLAASHVTNGKGLRLTKVGTAWRISSCGL